MSNYRRASEAVFRHKAEFPLTFKDRPDLARRFNCTNFQYVFYQDNLIGDIMDFGYASYPHLFEARFGASPPGQDFTSVEFAQCVCQIQFDEMKTDPKVIDQSAFLNPDTGLHYLKPPLRCLDS